jgi:hypothetical protein
LSSIDRDIVGTPLAMAEKVSAPNIKLRTISGFHRLARISDARATGQYWWYVPMGRSCHCPRTPGSSKFDLHESDIGVQHRGMRIHSSDNAPTGQVSTTAAEVYEEFFVPALFAQWAAPMLDAVDARPGTD